MEQNWKNCEEERIKFELYERRRKEEEERAYEERRKRLEIENHDRERRLMAEHRRMF